MQYSPGNYDTKHNMMAREIARRPASMFADRGAMNIAKTKQFLRII